AAFTDHLGGRIEHLTPALGDTRRIRRLQRSAIHIRGHRHGADDTPNVKAPGLGWGRSFGCQEDAGRERWIPLRVLVDAWRIGGRVVETMWSWRHPYATIPTKASTSALRSMGSHSQRSVRSAAWTARRR